jgi:hypothetical protein
MHQHFWGYKFEDKLYLGVREQKSLNTTALDDVTETCFPLLCRFSSKDELLGFIYFLPASSACRFPSHVTSRDLLLLSAALLRVKQCRVTFNKGGRTVVVV